MDCESEAGSRSGSGLKSKFRTIRGSKLSRGGGRGRSQWLEAQNGAPGGSVGDPDPDRHVFPGSGSFPFLKKVLIGLKYGT
jgi:hypothetical protein